jgi:membrane protein YqaA with SNARE-associated domain
MSLKLSGEPSSDFVEYNHAHKRFHSIFVISVICFVLVVVGVYFGFLRDLGLFKDTFVGVFLHHVGDEITSFSFMGFFYIFFFGGILLVFLPSDPYFVTSISLGKFQYINFVAIFFALLFSYIINYWVGSRFYNFSAMIVSPKEFYKVKNTVNMWGSWGILFSNIFLGCKEVTFVLGVFRYNKLRLFLLSFTGIVIKYVFLILVLKGIIILF